VRPASHDVADAVDRIGTDLGNVVDDGSQRGQIRMDVADHRNTHGGDSRACVRGGQSPARVQ
jgi:hypothetical protein